MKKLILVLSLVILCLYQYAYSQNVGIGTTTPTNTLHIVPQATNDPLKVEGVNQYLTETDFYVTDVTTGIVKYMPLDSLLAIISDSINTDDQNIDSVTLTGTILTVYIENGNSANVDLSSLGVGGTDDQMVDNFSLSGTTLTLEIESDGQAPHTVNLSSLQDGTGTDDQNLDSLRLNGTILTAYIESGSSTNVDLQPIIDSAISNSSLVDYDWDINANGTGLEGYPGNNVASGVNSIAAGDQNTATANNTVSFGRNNDATSNFSVVSGGIDNVASGIESVVGGGDRDTAYGTNATVSGGSENAARSGQSTVGGGNRNKATGANATISGGSDNTTNNTNTSIGGGFLNSATATASRVGGGQGNIASGIYSTVGGGYYNTASNNFTIIAGGESNVASGDNAVILGGEADSATGQFSYVVGGLNNDATGQHAGVLGGQFNLSQGSTSLSSGESSSAIGNFSLAIGFEANAYSLAEISLGRYNTPYTASSPSTFFSTDRFFVLGNGNLGALEDALVIQKNNNLFLGSDWTGVNGTGSRITSGDHVLFLNRGSAPGSLMGSNKAGIWNNAGEIQVKDESNNVTTISPHNFSLIPEGASEDLAWAFYSERDNKAINVDMAKLARIVENLSGEHLIYLKDLSTGTLELKSINQNKTVAGLELKIEKLCGENEALKEQNAIMQKDLKKLEHELQALKTLILSK